MDTSSIRPEIAVRPPGQAHTIPDIVTYFVINFLKS